MRVVTEHWKYIFKNLWFVLPFSILPAVFLALSADFGAVSIVMHKLFSGVFDLEFKEIFFAWSFFRCDSVLGGIYSALALLCLIFFSGFLLVFIEKHMRIGKRTLSGVFTQLRDHAFSFIGIVVFFVVLYEVWALVLSAVLFMVTNFSSDIFARILFVIVSVIFIAALFYIITAGYLWVPCKLHTGFRLYPALIYSYGLLGGVRWRLFFSMLISYAVCFFVVIGSVFGPLWLTRLLAAIMFMFAYMSFIVRMETLYFETDKLDREDLIRNYRGL